MTNILRCEKYFRKVRYIEKIFVVIWAILSVVFLTICYFLGIKPDLVPYIKDLPEESNLRSIAFYFVVVPFGAALYHLATVRNLVHKIIRLNITIRQYEEFNLMRIEEREEILARCKETLKNIDQIS